MSPARAAAATSDRAPDPPDFTRVFQQEFDYVWFALRRLGVPPSDLEDVTHDVFMRVYARLAQFDPSRPMRPWLFGFAYRTASDYRRKARHRLEAFGDTTELADPAPTAVEHVAARQAVELAWAALSDLDLDRRAVFVLHEIEGVPIPDVAEALEIPLNTAYSRLRLAREQFAKSARRLRLQRGEI